MIGYNGVENSAEVKKGTKKFTAFWGVSPRKIRNVAGPNLVLVGAGNTTGVYLTDAPTRKNAKDNWVEGGKTKIYFDTKGRKMVILGKGNQSKFGKGLKFVGYADETHYIPTRAIEKAGSFKAGTYWVHKHDDEGGRFPKVYKDLAGNFIYGPGTLRIGKWLRS
jgi:hypothetical protein